MEASAVADLDDLGSFLLGLRRGASMSQSDLADRIDTTQSAVSRWERNHEQPRLTTLHSILRACGFELRLVAAPAEDDAGLDGVDRAQIRQQLALSPEDRLASVVNLSRTLASARLVS